MLTQRLISHAICEAADLIDSDGISYLDHYPSPGPRAGLIINTKDAARAQELIDLDGLPMTLEPIIHNLTLITPLHPDS